MARRKQEKSNNTPLHVLSGPEIETLADYFGQGALGVRYYLTTNEKTVFHPLKDSYNDIIARPEDRTNRLCLSTDSNRSEEGNLYPKRTSIEFRSGPTQENTAELLHLTKAYADWLTEQKLQLRRHQFKNYTKPSRKEYCTVHYLQLSDFIAYYNRLDETKTPLYLTSPRHVFAPQNAGPDFDFQFPADARWVLQLSYADLAPKHTPIFTTQYNLSLPVGCVFDPQVKNAFPIATQFPLLNKEKEIAADFNESRPHDRFRAYEQHVFSSAIKLADTFFSDHKFPPCALGAKDFLRGMAYELAMVSTSQNFAAVLFAKDALWIAQQHIKAEVAKGHKDREPSKHEVQEIAISLANTLRKSIFPYFMKATLADFFKQLHPHEQQLLSNIPEKSIKSFCQHAINLANGGVGNSEDHPAYLIDKHDSFMEVFDDFYGQTFKGIPVEPHRAPADPIGFLSDRFITPVNIGSDEEPVKAVVMELRNPAQGNQAYPDIQQLCSTFRDIHQEILKAFSPIKRESYLALDALQKAKKPPVRVEPLTEMPRALRSLAPPLKALPESIAVDRRGCAFADVFGIKEIPTDGHCLYRSLVEGLVNLFPRRAYVKYRTYEGIIKHLRKEVSALFQAHPEHYHHLILDEEKDRRLSEGAPPTRGSKQAIIQTYIAEQEAGIRINRKTKEPGVHWGSGPELLAIRTHWKTAVPNLEIVVIKRNALGNLTLDELVST